MGQKQLLFGHDAARSLQVIPLNHRCHVVILLSNFWISGRFTRKPLLQGPAMLSVSHPGEVKSATQPCLQWRSPLRSKAGELVKHPLAGSDGRTNPLRHRRLCTDFPSRAASHTRTAGPEGKPAGPEPVPPAHLGTWHMRISSDKLT
jgi:hypothetical protein